MKDLSAKHACKEYLASLGFLEKHGVFSVEFISQLEDVSTFIKRKYT